MPKGGACVLHDLRRGPARHAIPMNEVKAPPGKTGLSRMRGDAVRRHETAG